MPGGIAGFSLLKTRPDAADEKACKATSKPASGGGSTATRHHCARLRCALIWGVGYLIWRVGWSWQGASPVAFVMLLVTEIYGLWALGTLTWYSWSRPPAVRPPATPGWRGSPAPST